MKSSRQRWETHFLKRKRSKRKRILFHRQNLKIAPINLLKEDRENRFFFSLRSLERVEVKLNSRAEKILHSGCCQETKTQPARPPETASRLFMLVLFWFQYSLWEISLFRSFPQHVGVFAWVYTPRRRKQKRAKPLTNRGNESDDHKIIILDYMKTASLYIWKNYLWKT